MLKGLFGKKTQVVPKVRLMGMNDRALNLFTMFLHGSVKGLCEVVSDGSHQIVIIDLDAVENTRLWLDLRRQFTGPAIVLSVREQSLANAFWVAKPIKEDQFKLAMEKATKALSQPPITPAVAPRLPDPPLPVKKEHQAEPIKPAPSAVGKTSAPEQKASAVTSVAAVGMNENMDERAQSCCGNLPEEAYLDLSRRQELFSHDTQSFVDVFREAMRRTAEGGMVNFVGLGAYPLYVSAAEDFVSTPMPEALLRSLCVRSTQSAPIELVLVDKKPKDIGPSDDERLRRLDNMLWKLALWSSRGRVKAGTSLDAPVRLRAWPNIPRLMSVPHSLRIAALWVMQPTGLLDTARKLDVPHRFVFAFYCACNAFDLVEQLGVGASSGTKHAPKNMTQEKRGLFGSLLKKLGF